MALWRVFAVLAALLSSAAAQDLPAGYWPLEKSAPIIAKLGTLRLAPDLSDLTPGERVAVGKILEVGAIFERLYAEQRHAQAASALVDLIALGLRLGPTEAISNLMRLYRMAGGPITTTLDNEREPFVPADPVQPGANVYPWKIAKAEVEAWLAAHPEDSATILAVRTVVRRADAANLTRDLAMLTRHPVLDGLHPGLRKGLERRLAAPDANALYAVPYAVAYADQMVTSHRLLHEAADAIQKDDPEFAGYLRNRARDLLTNDYESGDAAWVTGRFKTLNAVIGAYETYDDELFGTKAFYSLSLVKLRMAETDAMREALRDIQSLENSLPYTAHKTVRSDLPVGVYDVIADFGESRGLNTASILPNESQPTRRYGRTVLMRANILGSSTLEANRRPGYDAIAPKHRGEHTPRGDLMHTLWHEIGHYLGVDRTRDGRTLDVALQEHANLFDEMKSDLVSMYVADALHKRGYHTDAQLRDVYVACLIRVVNSEKPRPDQAHEMMQLLQFNYFLEHGFVRFDAASGTAEIDQSKAHGLAKELLAQVLDVQYQGDKAEAERFIAKYGAWDEKLHGVLAQKLRDGARVHYWIVDYAAINP